MSQIQRNITDIFSLTINSIYGTSYSLFCNAKQSWGFFPFQSKFNVESEMMFLFCNEYLSEMMIFLKTVFFNVYQGITIKDFFQSSNNIWLVNIKIHLFQFHLLFCRGTLPYQGLTQYASWVQKFQFAAILSK